MSSKILLEINASCTQRVYMVRQGWNSYIIPTYLDGIDEFALDPLDSFGLESVLSRRDSLQGLSLPPDVRTGNPIRVCHVYKGGNSRFRKPQEGERLHVGDCDVGVIFGILEMTYSS
jgi:hypothetical protein